MTQLPDLDSLRRQAKHDLTASQLTIPLRFAKSQGKALRDRAHWMRTNDIHTELVTLFEQAAEATEKDEPLMIECDSINEVRAIAAAFSIHGVRAPTIG